MIRPTITPAYMTLRAAGHTPAQVRQALGLRKKSTLYEALWQAETNGGGTDETVPKFARDPEYIDLLLEADPRGFGRIEGGRMVFG